MPAAEAVAAGIDSSSVNMATKADSEKVWLSVADLKGTSDSQDGVADSACAGGGLVAAAAAAASASASASDLAASTAGFRVPKAQGEEGEEEEGVSSAQTVPGHPNTTTGWQTM